MNVLPWRTSGKSALPGRGSIDGRPRNSIQVDPLASLWEKAYQQLMKDQADLIKTFNKVLNQEVGSIGETITPGKMSALVTAKLQKLNDKQWRIKLGKQSIILRDQLDRIVKVMVVAKEVGSLVANIDPVHIGVPWAGVCVLLSLLTNDSTQRSEAMNGLEYVSRLIPRFDQIERLYLGAEDHRLKKQLQGSITKLYMKVLEYQARSVCQFSRSTVVQAARNLVKADDWVKILQEIKDGETDCIIITKIVDTEYHIQRSDRLESMLQTYMEQVNNLVEESRLQDEQYQRELVEELRSTRFEARERHFNHEEDMCMSSFRVTDYELAKNKNPRRTSGTCEWFSTHKKFEKWLHSENKDWLWVTADPGCGKSVLSRHLVDTFHKEVVSKDWKPGDISNILYYFFKDDSDAGRSVQICLISLIHQLCSQNKLLLKHAIKIWSNNRNGNWFYWDLERAFFAAVADEHAGKTVVVLDALDECEEDGRLRLLGSLATFFGAKTPCQFKIVITSRPNTPMGYAIQSAGIDPSSIRLMGENEEEMKSISIEINLVIAARIQQLCELRRNAGIVDDAHETLLKKMSEMNNRTYLWVALVFPEIEKNIGRSKSKFLKAIEDIPSSIDDAYEKILNRSPDPQQAKYVLNIIIAARRPLSVTEMNICLSLIPPAHQKNELEPASSFPVYVRELCGLFINIQHQRLFLIHQTAKEFLLAELSRDIKNETLKASVWKNSIFTRESNEILARICILLLLSKRKPTWQENSVRGQLVRYASENWHSHFYEAIISSQDLDNSLQFPLDSTTTLSSWFDTYTRIDEWEQEHPELSPLLLSALHGHIVVFSKLLESSTIQDIYAVDPKGYTALHLAIKKKHVRIVDLLLEKIPDIDEHAHLLCSATHVAASVGNADALKKLYTLQTVKKNGLIQDDLGQDVYFWAIKEDQRDALEVLLPMFDIFDFFHSVIVTAVAANRAWIVEWMIESADLDQSYEPPTEPYDWPSLQQAANDRNLRIVKALLKLWPNKEHVIRAKSLATFSAFNGHDENKKDLFEILRLLVEAGANVNARDRNGETLLYKAVVANSEEMVRYFIDKGADPNIAADLGFNSCKYGGGTSALSLAVGTGRLGICSILIEAGASVGFIGENQMNLLHICQVGSIQPDAVQVAQLLLEKGVSPDAEDVFGYTPRQLAELRPEEREDDKDSVMNLCALFNEHPKKSVPRTLPRVEAVFLSNLSDLDRRYYSKRVLGESGLFDLDVWDQLLEMDESDAPGETTFSKLMMISHFEQWDQRELDLQKHVALRSFYEVRMDSYFQRGSCGTCGLEKVRQLCQDVEDATELEKDRYISRENLPGRMKGKPGISSDDVDSWAKAVRLLQEREAEQTRTRELLAEFYREWGALCGEFGWIMKHDVVKERQNPSQLPEIPVEKTDEPEETKSHQSSAGVARLRAASM